MELAELQSCGQVRRLEIASKEWEIAHQEKRGIPAKEGGLAFEVTLTHVAM